MVKWLTVEEVARYLRTTPSTVYKLKAKGKIRGYRAGRTVLFDPDEIDEDVKRSGKKGPKQERRPGANAHNKRVS
jgi:excisionase family DNA binding protein